MSQLRLELRTARLRELYCRHSAWLIIFLIELQTVARNSRRNFVSKRILNYVLNGSHRSC
jgi:hypothetical protein